MIVAIPDIIENSIWIDTVPNEDKSKRPDIEYYAYYIIGLNINGVDYALSLIKKMISFHPNCNNLDCLFYTSRLKRKGYLNLYQIISSF